MGTFRILRHRTDLSKTIKDKSVFCDFQVTGFLSEVYSPVMHTHDPVASHLRS